MNLYRFHTKPETLHGDDDDSLNDDTAIFNHRLRRQKGIPTKAQLKLILRTPHTALHFAQDQKRRFPEGEKLIASNWRTALNYAEKVLKGPFPKGETIIANHKEAAVNYAVFALKDRFPKGEKVIAADKYKRNWYNEHLTKIGYPKSALLKKPE